MEVATTLVTSSGSFTKLVACLPSSAARTLRWYSSAKPSGFLASPRPFRRRLQSRTSHRPSGFLGEINRLSLRLGGGIQQSVHSKGGILMKLIDGIGCRSLELELSSPVSLLEFAGDCSSVVYSSDLIERLLPHLPFHLSQVLDVGSSPVFTPQILHLGHSCTLPRVAVYADREKASARTPTHVSAHPTRRLNAALYLPSPAIRIASVPSTSRLLLSPRPRSARVSMTMGAVADETTMDAVQRRLMFEDE
ncbi:hypothetical protein B296_00007992 [Ensete ventricosum]|uniref:Uncharacterized protein n=1 Tax=Ensete ventricosum TaxID=4639 RepID=A0A427AIY7_ENSVE|nr:hypothetical protein B296_00007992 [Ensete ventricosum]